jgi:hypothetical protein
MQNKLDLAIVSTAISPKPKELTLDARRSSKNNEAYQSPVIKHN